MISRTNIRYILCNLNGYKIDNKEAILLEHQMIPRYDRLKYIGYNILILIEQDISSIIKNIKLKLRSTLEILSGKKK